MDEIPVGKRLKTFTVRSKMIVNPPLRDYYVNHPIDKTLQGKIHSEVKSDLTVELGSAVILCKY